MKKRAKEREEADLYTKYASNSRYKQSTSNRKERGLARDKLPHIQLADRLEAIRLTVERRPNSAYVHRLVPRKNIPRYYEIISKPIDLQKILDKNFKYGYKTAHSFLRDFDVMMNNAIKFNGVGSVLGNEATAIYDSVRNAVETNRTAVNLGDIKQDGSDSDDENDLTPI